MVSISLIFTLMILFALKHFIADYPLQSNKFMLGKFKSGVGFILPLTAHSAVHALFTFAIGWFVNPLVAIHVALIDFCLHFMMDRVKASPDMMGKWKNFSAREHGFLEHKQCFLPPSIYDDIVTEVVPDENGPRDSEGKPFFTVPEHWLKLKSATVREYNQTYWHNTLFWNALGFDQWFHGMTDILIMYILIKW